MFKRGRVIVLAMIFLTPVGFAAAGPKGERGPLHGLNLSTEQLQEARSMRAAMKKELIRIKAEMDIKQIDFHEELQVEEPDKKKLAGLIADSAALAARKTTARLKMQVEMARILTPEQKRKLQRRHASRMFDRRAPEKEGRRWERGSALPSPPPPGE